MVDTPPAQNPIRHCAQKRQHWGNPQEIKPGYWQVEEGSGPRATTRRLAIVSHIDHATYPRWQYRGWVDVWRGGARGQLQLWLAGRDWRITGPVAECVEQLIALVERYG